MSGLRDRLFEGLAAAGVHVRLNGHPTERLPDTLNVSFVGLDGNLLLSAVPEIAASTGSACHSDRTDPSGVLLAMQVQREIALGAVRFSLGRWTTPEEIDRAAKLANERGWLQTRHGQCQRAFARTRKLASSVGGQWQIGIK